MGEQTFGPLPHTKFHVYRPNVSPLWGEKPILGPLSKNNNMMIRNALLCCKRFDWSFSDFTSGKLSLCNTNFGTFHNLSITQARQQSGLFLCELLDLRDQESVHYSDLRLTI